MHWKLMFPTNSLSAADLKGEDVVLTIREVKPETVKTDHGEKVLFAMFFQESKNKGTDDEKRLYLNVTNSKTIAKLHGEDIADDWPGNKIQLYPTETTFKGEVVDCIRVRAKVPEPVKEKA